LSIYLIIFITLVAALIASGSQFLYKKGIKNEIRGLGDILALAENRTVVLGGVGYVSSLVIYLYAISQAPLSVVYPTFASSFVFVTFISAALLKESVGRLRLAGVALIFIGIAVIALSV
jgi:drug/metabolite transporter (DMT)-like permease